MPKVSIILPTYNRAHTIGLPIRSVLDQTFRDFELIVVDDGSADNTEEVVLGYQDDRIRYIKQKENRGAPSARNAGISAARGKYIAFQDSSDEWMPEKLERQVEVLDKATEPVVVYCAVWRYEKGVRYIVPPSDIEDKEGDIHLPLLRGNFIDLPAVIMPRECLEKSGLFNESLPRLQDWDLFIRLSMHFKFRFIDEPLCVSSYQEDSISANRDALLVAREIILDSNREYFSEVGRQFLAEKYKELGVELCMAGKVRSGRRMIMEAIFTFPIKINYWAWLLISLFGRAACTTYLNAYLRFAGRAKNPDGR